MMLSIDHTESLRCRACRCQEVDLFGEVGGISFSPDGSSFFISIADVVYSSLQEYIVTQDWKKVNHYVY